MNSDMNIATRRLLQVVLDMLSNPSHAEESRERRYRCDYLAVEAAFRAAKEAQQMLFEASTHPGYTVEVPMFGCSDGDVPTKS